MKKSKRKKKLEKLKTNMEILKTDMRKELYNICVLAGIRFYRCHYETDSKKRRKKFINDFFKSIEKGIEVLDHNLD